MRRPKMSKSTSRRLEKSAEIILKQCMGLKRNESLLIVTDKNKRKIAEVIRDKAINICGRVELVEKKVGDVHGQEPESWISKEMLKHDAIIMATTKSLSHTKARKNACRKGARVASMPGITEDTMERAVPIDYTKMKRMIDRISGIKERNEISVTTGKGTALTMRAGKRKWFSDYGIYTKKGSFGNLPAGEICLAPLEGTTEGVFVVDRSIGCVGKVDKPVKIYVEEGYVVDIRGGSAARKLKEMLSGKGKDAYSIAEFGIGTNPLAIISGTTLEDEKVIGTIHIAVGNNQSFGGKVSVPLHIDCILSCPTVTFDDKVIMDNGKFMI